MTPKLQAAVAALARIGLNPLPKWHRNGWDLDSEFTRRQRLIYCAKMVRERLGQEIREATRLHYDAAQAAIQEALDEIAVYRVRDGVSVRVPDEWVGHTTCQVTKDARQERAKLKRKERRNRLRKEAEFDRKASE